MPCPPVATVGDRLLGVGCLCVQLYACKPITTGEGGMIVTRDPKIAARARVMRTHGLDRDAFDRFRKVGASWAYDVVAPGFKYNLTDVAAAIGVVQLSRAESLQASRQRAAERYLKKLAGLPIDCPAAAPTGGLNAWHMFPIRVHESARANRDDLIASLAAEGIGASVHYRPLHEMTYWKERYHCEQSEFRSPVAILPARSPCRCLLAWPMPRSIVSPPSCAEILG